MDYYAAATVMEKLEINSTQLLRLVRAGRIRVQDDPIRPRRKQYSKEDVDAIAEQLPHFERRTKVG